MELMGIIRALEQLKEPCDISFCSDSKYVMDGLSKGWAKGWRARGWVKSDKKPRAEQRPVGAPAGPVRRPHLSLQLVKGHAGHPENERLRRACRAGGGPVQVISAKKLPEYIIFSNCLLQTTPNSIYYRKAGHTAPDRLRAAAIQKQGKVKTLSNIIYVDNGRHHACFEACFRRHGALFLRTIRQPVQHLLFRRRSGGPTHWARAREKVARALGLRYRRGIFHELRLRGRQLGPSRARRTNLQSRAKST